MRIWTKILKQNTKGNNYEMKIDKPHYFKIKIYFSAPAINCRKVNHAQIFTQQNTIQQ